MSKQFFKFNPWLLINPNSIGGAELRLMIFLCYNMDFKNTIIFDDAIQEILCQQMNIKTQELKRLLKLLEQKQLIYKIGFYLHINENFAKKGK